MTSSNQSFASNAVTVYLGIALFVALLYGYTLSFSYAGDDTALIKENKLVQKGLSSFTDLATKSTFYGFNEENFGAYRPLTMLTFATEVTLWGNKPGLSHLVNLLLYILSGCLLYKVLSHLFREQPLVVLLMVLLFMAHPVHTEVVANIKSRDEILAFLFSLLIPLYLLCKKEGTRTTIALAYASFFLGLFAKENAVTFFVPIVLALYFFQEKTIKDLILYSIPFVLLIGVYLGLRNILLDPIPDSSETITNSLYHCHTWSEKMGTVAYILWAYLKLLIAPVRLSWDHSFSDIPVVSFFKPVALFSTLLHVGLLVYAVWHFNKRSVAVYLIFFYFSTLFLFLNIVFPLSQNIAERFLLVPSLSFCIALVLLLKKLSEKVMNGSSTLLYIVCSLVLVFYTVRTIKRNPIWKNNDAFFESVVKDAPESFHAHQMLGMYLSTQADESTDANRKVILYTKAKECFERSLAIYQGFQINWYMLGRCAQLTGDSKRAEQAYLESVNQFEEKNIESYYNLAVLYKETGNFNKALLYFGKVNALQANFQETNSLMGEMFLQQNKKDRAELYLNKAYETNKTNKIILNNLGVLHYTEQRYAKAEFYFKAAVQADSCFLDGLKNAAASCQVQQKNGEAIAFYEKAIRCYPLQKDLYPLVIALLGQTGNAVLANKYQVKLNELNPR